MNYKKILKSQGLRFRILNLFSWVPDKTMVKIQYRIKTGRKLNLKDPKRYTEKLQLYKLKYRNKTMKRCADKYEVRKYIESKGLGNILNELYGVYDSPDEIDFNKLPKSFVLKDTLGGGGNSVILVADKSKINLDEIKEKMKHWVGKESHYKNPGREWVYDGQKHRIIVEKYLISEDQDDLPDYKFFCFNGKTEYFYKRSGYAKNHDGGVMSFYDRNGNWLKGVGLDYCKTSPKKQPLCKELNGMMKIAETLSSDFPHVRVDLYNIDGRIVFGELTFFNASGYMIFTPDEFDFELGEKFKYGGKYDR